MESLYRSIAAKLFADRFRNKDTRSIPLIPKNTPIILSLTDIVRAIKKWKMLLLFADDPRSFLRSYPVLEGVVADLNLQATLTEKKIGARFQEIWHTLLSARAY